MQQAAVQHDLGASMRKLMLPPATVAKECHPAATSQRVEGGRKYGNGAMCAAPEGPHEQGIKNQSHGHLSSAP